MKIIKSSQILLIFNIIFSTSLLADTCPNPSQIKQGEFGGWQVYLQTGELGTDVRLATPSEIKTFETLQISSSGIAYWSKDPIYPLSGMCNYWAYMPDQYHSFVFLLKSEPKPASSDWIISNNSKDDFTMFCRLGDGGTCSYP